MVAARAWGCGGIGGRLFKGTHQQIVRKSGGSNAHSDYSQQYCIINLEVAKRLDLNCSHYKKEIIMWAVEVSANATIVIMVHCNQTNTLHTFKLHGYMSITSQFKNKSKKYM